MCNVGQVLISRTKKQTKQNLEGLQSYFKKNVNYTNKKLFPEPSPGKLLTLFQATAQQPLTKDMPLYCHSAIKTLELITFFHLVVRSHLKFTDCLSNALCCERTSFIVTKHTLSDVSLMSVGLASSFSI